LTGSVTVHGPDCGCVRCTGFTRGNDLALTHGATATITLAPRASALADDLRAIVPACSEADEPTIRLAALVLARVEAANIWLDEHGLFRDAKGEPQPVIRVLSTWENTAARLLDRLGCTPTSRAKLGLDVALAQRVSEQALSGLAAEGREIRERRERTA
jgi:hypothetical protein